MVEPTGFATLFEPEPQQWGLRGDPLLWRAMREELNGAAFPKKVSELEFEMARIFELLTGHSIEEEDIFRVPAFESRGMSSGGISPRFWREEAIPLLTARLLGQC